MSFNFIYGNSTIRNLIKHDVQAVNRFRFFLHDSLLMFFRRGHILVIKGKVSMFLFFKYFRSSHKSGS